SCATVLLIDISHSMTLYGEDRITPAKRVALALTELILTKYPKDTIDVVLFGDEARVVALDKLPYITNGPFHTNTRAGLITAQEILKRKRSANRQIIMITDGKPSAIHEEGRLYKNPYGLDPKVVARTLDEAGRCRRKGIPITTFMLTSDPYLKSFVQDFTEVNRGRAYFAESARLESFVLVDFLKNRRRRV
ncbi:MAG: VWA domain-containing protein, partial [Planctomycetota bacterium]